MNELGWLVLIGFVITGYNLYTISKQISRIESRLIPLADAMHRVIVTTDMTLNEVRKIK